MDWGDVAKSFGPLLGAAAPTLGSVLGGLIPLPGGSFIGEEVGKIIANQFGVQPTPEAVNNAIQNSPTDQAMAKLQAAEAEAVAKWPALAQIAQAQADVGKAQVTSVNAAIAAEAAAGGDGFWGKWRAVHAWELTAECPFFVATMLHAVWVGDSAGISSLVQLSGILMTYMGARFGVLGVHVWQGSNERQTALQQVPQMVPVIKKLVGK